MFGVVILGCVAGGLLAVSVRDPLGSGVLIAGGGIGLTIGLFMGRGFAGGTRVEWARWEGRAGRGFAAGMAAMGAWWLAWGLAEPDALLSVGGLAALLVSPWMHATVTREEAENVEAARQHEEGLG